MVLLRRQCPLSYFSKGGKGERAWERGSQLNLYAIPPISYPESSGSLVSGLVARRDSGEMEFFPQKSGVPVVVRMLSFIKTEVNVSREVGMLDESLDGNQKS